MSNMEEGSGLSKRDIEFLYEVGCLRFIDRAWKQFLNLGGANLAEHTLRVTWLAALIAKHENADVSKVVKMALVHDLSESRTGDVHYVSRLYTQRDEVKAINDILKDTVLEEEFIELWKESDAHESIESKIVKDADNLDVEFEIQEMILKGYKPSEGWVKARKGPDYPKLYTQTGKKIREKINASNPNDWHFKGVNRFTEGDWKE